MGSRRGRAGRPAARGAAGRPRYLMSGRHPPRLRLFCSSGIKMAARRGAGPPPPQRAPPAPPSYWLGSQCRALIGRPPAPLLLGEPRRAEVPQARTRLCIPAWPPAPAAGTGPGAARWGERGLAPPSVRRISGRGLHLCEANVSARAVPAEHPGVPRPVQDGFGFLFLWSCLCLLVSQATAATDGALINFAHRKAVCWCARCAVSSDTAARSHPRRNVVFTKLGTWCLTPAGARRAERRQTMNP